jgi:hypothetical protein
MERFRKYPFVEYYWYVPNPVTGRMRRTRYRMTESEAAKYPGAVKDIFESLEIRAPGDEERAP